MTNPPDTTAPKPETKTARKKRLKALRRAAEERRRRTDQERERWRAKLRQRMPSEAWLEVILSRGEYVTKNQPRKHVPDLLWKRCHCRRCVDRNHMGWPKHYMTSSGHSYECYLDYLAQNQSDGES